MHSFILFLFFFYGTATTQIYTLSPHRALPISRAPPPHRFPARRKRPRARAPPPLPPVLTGHVSSRPPVLTGHVSPLRAHTHARTALSRAGAAQGAARRAQVVEHEVRGVLLPPLVLSGHAASLTPY